MKPYKIFYAVVLLSLCVVLFVQSSEKAQGETESVTTSVGFRTEDPGPFLSWPLPHVNITSITRLPHTPWTHNFLGIETCPSYPALIDAGYWPNAFKGNYAGNRHLIKNGVPDSSVKWVNAGKSDGFDNAFACYGARSGLPDHAGTDFSAADGTDVLASAWADQIYVYFNNGQYRIRLRHPNVNGSGQTWYTYYVHLSASSFPMGTRSVNIDAGQKIGEVGQRHLHFEVAVGPDYSGSQARNPWGIDRAPWQGCLWLDQTLCPIPNDTARDNQHQASTGHFPDIPISDWRLPYIETLYHIGAVGGFSDGTYRPNNPTSRGAAAKIIILGLGRNPNYQDNIRPFPDVPPSNVFYQYIRDLKELDITNGYSDGTYRPDENLTRCGAAFFITKARAESFHYNDGRRVFNDISTNHFCYQVTRHLYELGISRGYSDGTFRPDDAITRGDMAVFTVRGLPNLVDQMPSFHDVLHDNPFFPYVEAIYERGITRGCSSTSPYPIFCPDDILTRGQTAAFVSRGMGFTAQYNDGRRSFSDVPPSHTFYHVIEHLRELGIVNGFSDGTFKPEQNINRRDIARLVVRGLNHLGVSCPSNHSAPFPDVPVGSEAYAEIQCMKDLEISSGFSDGTYRPNENVTRAAAAKFMDIAFIRIAHAIEQEPEDAQNNSFNTAPLVPLVEEISSTPQESFQEAPPQSATFIIPNNPEIDDVDIALLELEGGEQYEIPVHLKGPNIEIGLQLFVEDSNRSGDISLQEIPLHGSSSRSATGITTLNTVNNAWFTAPKTGRYYFRFTNQLEGVQDGVNFTFSVRKRIEMQELFLPIVIR